MSGAAKALVIIDPTLLRGARAEVDGCLIPLMARLEVRFTGSMMLRGQGSAAIRNLSDELLLLGQFPLSPGQQVALQIRRSMKITVAHGRT
jgi:hypothetical protein